MEVLSQGELPPYSDAISVVSPAVVQYIRLPKVSTELCPHALGIGEVLEIQRK
eukprot:SAG31_NODE_41285_length_277_cov_0.426966_1_plen_52_part_01